MELAIVAMLEEFFSHDNAILDYICDSLDGRQATRQRLFSSWVTRYAKRDDFTFKTMSMDLEGIRMYASVLLKKDGRLHDQFLKAVDNFINDMTGKL